MRLRRRCLTAIKRKPAVCLLGFECAFGGIAFGNKAQTCGLLVGVRVRLRWRCLTAIKRKPAVCLLEFGCAFGGVPYGKGLRAPPCTRKGHRPLTRDCASRSACFCGFGGRRRRMTACRRLTQAVRLAYMDSGFAFGGVALRQGFAGSALHPQGTSSLDP